VGTKSTWVIGGNTFSLTAVNDRADSMGSLKLPCAAPGKVCLSHMPLGLMASSPRFHKAAYNSAWGGVHDAPLANVVAPSLAQRARKYHYISVANANIEPTQIDDAMRAAAAANATGIVIDLRGNSGGDDPNGAALT
jgi:hypothetical protein